MEAWEHWTKDVHRFLSVGMWGVCVCERGGRQTQECLMCPLQLWPTVFLRKPFLNWSEGSLKQIKRFDKQDVDREPKINDAHMALFFPAGATDGKRQEIRDDYVCEWSNQSVFILMEQCCLTRVSVRYGPGHVFSLKKHRCLYFSKSKFMRTIGVLCS